MTDPDPLRLEHLVEGGAEPQVTVVDEEFDRTDAEFPYLGKIAGDLVHQERLVAPSVTPPMRTFPVWRSMKKSTWSVFSLIDSTVNRSQAMIEAAWFRVNWHQVSRFGPGRRFGEVIRRILEAEISMPSFFSSPLDDLQESRTRRKS